MMAIRLNDTRVALVDEQDAEPATVYNFLAYEHHGEFAKYNLPLEVE